MADIKTQIITPSGGMNQDDSMIVPSPGTDGAGSYFEAGDYKYAANARIGSSRRDTFGDVEDIVSTLGISDFARYQSVVSNPEFNGSLTPWSQISAGLTWSWSASNARISTAGSSTQSNVLYQAVSPLKRRLSISVKYVIETGFSSGVDMYLVFLNGSTVVSTKIISAPGAYTSETTSLFVDLPTGCNGVGIQFLFTTSGTSALNLEYFRVNGWVSAVKPSGTENIIGRLEDQSDQRLYYAVWNDNEGSHSIRFFDKATATCFELLKWNLNFGEYQFVKFAKIKNWLAFTDRKNNPRLIDVDSINDTFLNLGSNFREFHISFHKWAPSMPPVVKHYYDGSTNNAEKFKGKYFQFAYQYIFKGNLKSCYSPHSTVANVAGLKNGFSITALDISFPGCIYNDPSSGSAYNFFNHNDAKFTEAVESIQLVYRESEIDLWRMLKRIDFNSDSKISYRYTGDSNSTPIADSDFYPLFDTVPFLAGTIESVDNRFVFFDIEDEKPSEGKPIINSISVVASDPGLPSTKDWNYGAPDQPNNSSIFSGMSGADAQELGLRNIVTKLTFKSRGIYKAAIIYQTREGWVSGGYTTDNFTFRIPESSYVAEDKYALAFKFSDSFKPPVWATAYQIVRTNCLNIDYFMFGCVNKFDFLIDNPNQVLGYETASKEYQSAINLHFDNNTLVTATELEKIKDPTPKYFNFLNKIKNVGSANGKKSIADQMRERNKLKNDGNRVSPLAFIVSALARNTQKTASLSEASRLYINVNNWYNSSKKNAAGNVNNPMNNLFYNYRQGDRVRFTGSTTSTTPTQSQKQVFDMPILEFTGTAIVCSKPEGLLWLPDMNNHAQDNPGYDYTIEVYTPKESIPEDYTYFETGEWYPVLYPGTEQRTWSKSDWTYTNNAAVTCTTFGDVKVYNKLPMFRGDCSFISKNNYFNLRGNGLFSSLIRTACMTNNRDETYGYWDRADGRVNFTYDDLPIPMFKETMARFGGRLITESTVNQINKFFEQDQFVYPYEFGRIRNVVNTANAQIESAGSVLLAMGERKSFSIYVNRTTLADLSGRTQVALSDKLLGSFNILLGDHGCLNPESVSFDRDHVYWWDQNNGCWVRYGRDGATDISSYKMQNWFREIADLIDEYYLTDTPPWVLSDFDGFNEELVTYISHPLMPETFREYPIYKGVLFSERGKRWKSCHNYKPQMIGRLKNQLFLWVDGDIHMSEKGDSYLEFFGEKQDMYFEPVFNNDATSMKLWQILWYIATHKWSIERIQSEYRGDKPVQSSSLTLTQIEDYEDTFKAAVLNDENSSGGKIEGNKMRSRAIQVLMKLDPEVTTRSLLQYVISGYIDSAKNA
jgi:hypothetical protein